MGLFDSIREFTGLTDPTNYLGIDPESNIPVTRDIFATAVSGIEGLLSDVTRDPLGDFDRLIGNIDGLDLETLRNTLSPEEYEQYLNNFDRLGILDQLPISNILGDDALSSILNDQIFSRLREIDPSNFKLSEFLNDIGQGLKGEFQRRGQQSLRGIIQEIKDIGNTGLRSILTGENFNDLNRGVTDYRLGTAYGGPKDIDNRYFSKTLDVSAGDTGISSPTGAAGKGQLRGLTSAFNPYVVFRLNRVATGGADDRSDQWRRVLDKEGFSGYAQTMAKNPTATNLVRRFPRQKNNPTPYSSADFLWCKHYPIIPNSQLITLRRYMYPIQDNLTRSPYLRKNFKVGNWGVEPVAQMVTWWGGETGNDLSDILAFSYFMNWEELNPIGDDGVMKITGEIPDVSKLYDAFKGTLAGGALTKGTEAVLSKISGAFPGGKKFGSLSNIFMSSLSDENRAALLGAMMGIVDPAYASGLRSQLLHWDPYEGQRVLSDRIYGPVNVIYDSKKRARGLKSSHRIEVKFQYSLKSIGHVNPKVVMLDIFSNVLATTYNHAPFWGGEYRNFLDEGRWPLAPNSMKYIEELYKGNYKEAADELWKHSTTVLNSVWQGVSDVASSVRGFFEKMKDGISNPGGLSTSEVGTGVFGTGGMGTGLDFADAIMKTKYAKAALDYSKMELLANLSIAMPDYQALRTGAPVGEWHLTVGNPFDPIARIGNLIVTNTRISFDGPLGVDHFPEDLTVTVTLEQGRSRDAGDLQSMFNDGYGRMYYPKDPGNRPTERTTSQDQQTQDSQFEIPRSSVPEPVSRDPLNLPNLGTNNEYYGDMRSKIGQPSAGEGQTYQLPKSE